MENLTAEYWPYVRTGGLGEAVRGMATFQIQAGSEATVILPLFRTIRQGDWELRPIESPFEVRVGPRIETARLWEISEGTEGPRILLLENPGYFDRGGVYAIANIRGGGEYGPEWHSAALRENRHKAFEDFEAVAEDLIARKVTTPARLGIQGIPTMILFQGGKEVDRLVGALPKAQLERWIDSALSA